MQIEKIILDRGLEQYREIPGGRCIEDAIRSAGYPVEDAFRSEYPSDEEVLVILRSNSVIPSMVETSGVLVYPGIRQLTMVSDKLKLARWSQKQGISHPQTRLLPQYYVQNHIASPYADDFGENFIIKPRLSLGSAALIGKQVYHKPYSEWQSIRGHLDIIGDDAVIQRKMRGTLVKVYGVYPDKFYYYEYPLEQHDQQRIIRYHDQIEMSLCPSDLVELCNKILSLLDLKWSGFDFIRDENGVHNLIDVNPVSGGRPIPEEDRLAFNKQLHQAIETIISGIKR